jgi:hypothetical protein
LDFLKGRDKLKGYDVMSLLRYEKWVARKMGPEAFGKNRGGGLNSDWSHASSERWCSESRTLDVCILRHLGCAPTPNS